MESLSVPYLRRSPAGRLSDDRGLALIASILVLALLGVLTAFAVSGALNSVRTSTVDYQDARTMYAAEAGTELALAQIKQDLRDGYLSDAEMAAIQPPSLPGFSFDSFAVVKTGQPEVEAITDGPYAGLYAITDKVDVFSRASDASGNVSGVVLGAKAQAIPIFQFGVFFERDLEATNGPPMEFVGRVHSNGNIYLSSNNAWYREIITTPNKIFHDRKDHHDVLNGVWINDASGTEKQLNFDSRSVPDPEKFKKKSEKEFDSRVMTDAFGVDSLRLPLPAGVAVNDIVLPRDASDTQEQKDVKYAWNADTYVTVDLTNVDTYGTVCGGLPAPVASPPLYPTISIDRGGKPVPTAAEACGIFKWTWSAFYDGREKDMRDVLDIDVQALSNWVAVAPAQRRVEIIYIDFILPSGISAYPTGTRNWILDATIDPSVRVVNGSQLPNRMTVATEWPVYVKGNYNTVAKQPAALVGDAINVLSNSWQDDQNRPSSGVYAACVGDVQPGNPCTAYENWNWSYRGASETTINAAILAGSWPTPCDHEDAGCPGGYQDFYGGGIENYPRFLENWSGVWYHYKGSLISPFSSQTTHGTWNGSYYVPPKRDWSFDLDFRNPELLPPGTPNVGVVVRTAFREEF